MGKIWSSKQTKKYRKGYWITTVLSWSLVLGPLIGYVIYGFITGQTVQKFSLGVTTMAALALTGFSIIFKKHIRSTIFIVLLGIYIALREITILLIILSICTILDEFVITPLQKSYREKLVINSQIDRRIVNASKD